MRSALGASRARIARAFLAESLPSWPPFPDTNAALERLARSGVRLGILSNVDDDLRARNPRPPQSVFDAKRRELNLDKPLPVRYGIWLKEVVTGNFGYSYRTGQAVIKRIGERVPATVELMGAALIFSTRSSRPSAWSCSCSA